MSSGLMLTITIELNLQKMINKGVIYKLGNKSLMMILCTIC